MSEESHPNLSEGNFPTLPVQNNNPPTHSDAVQNNNCVCGESGWCDNWCESKIPSGNRVGMGIKGQCNLCSMIFTRELFIRHLKKCQGPRTYASVARDSLYVHPMSCPTGRCNDWGCAGC